MPENLGSARQRVLRAVETLAESGPVHLTGLVQILGGHPNTTRQHLDRLVSAGLLTSTTEASGRPGRPPKMYALTDRGKRAVSADPYGSLVGAVTSHLSALPDPQAAAHALGSTWGSSAVTGAVGEPAAIVVELLDILGFEPRTAGDHGEVVLTACPMLAGCADHQPLACTMHQGMLDGALRQLGDSQGVRLVPFSHPDGCGVFFTDLADTDTDSDTDTGAAELAAIA